MTDLDLTEDDVTALRTQGDFKTYIRDTCRAAHTEAARLRRLVLRHPDLAARLCEPPLACTTPEHWTGYVPPALTNGAPNTSPVRAQLAAIVQAAAARARGAPA